MVELKKITILSDNMKDCIELDIAPEKKEHMWSNAVTLAIAHRRYKRFCTAMECRAIYANGTMVGLVSYCHYVEFSPDFKETCYRIRWIMVDKNHQDRGYEEAALRLLLDEIRTKPLGEATAIFATYRPQEEDVAKIYEATGFAKINMPNQGDEDVIVRMGL